MIDVIVTSDFHLRPGVTGSGSGCSGLRPDGISYNAVMGACGEASCWQLVLHLLGNVPLNVISFNTAAKTFDRFAENKHAAV